jgi:hypothetical protein
MSTRTGLISLSVLFLGSLAASIFGIIALADVVPAARPAILWSVGVVMVAALPAIVIKPVNLALLTLLGGSTPHQHEWRRIEPLLGTLAGTTLIRGRYRPILVTRYDGMFSDIGFYAITVPQVALAYLSTDELRTLLIQRARRQERFLSPMLGLCLWAILPLALGVALAYVAFQIARFVGRLLNGVADGMKPKSELGAATGLLLYVGALVAFFAALVAGMVVLLQALIALVVVSVGAWCFRHADLQVTADIVHDGRGKPLRSAFVKLDAARPPARFLQRTFGVRASLDAHLRRIATI